MRRIANGSLNSDFRLHSVLYLVMFPDSSRNQILLNEEVEFMPNVKYKNSKNFKAGEIVNVEDIHELLGLYADSTNAPNAAHIMLTKFNERWYYACDLIYELESSRKLREKAAIATNIANENMKNKNWRLFLDNLLHVCMLSTQAIFILQYDKQFSLKRPHGVYIQRRDTWAIKR